MTLPATLSRSGATRTEQHVGGWATTTPTLVRNWGLVLIPLITVTGLVAVVGGFVVQNAARATDGATGPSLIGVQNLFASVAEANTAATASHLAVDATGEEDRAGRNLYTDALARSQEQLTGVAAGVGREPEIESRLETIGSALVAYNGQVEAARLANGNDLPEADERLRAAVDIVDSDVAPAVGAITTVGRDRYDDEAGQGLLVIAGSLVIGLITLGAMIGFQLQLARRTRRVLDPLMVLATAAVIGLIGLVAYSSGTRIVALSEAKTGGLNAIGSSAEMQEAAFSLQSELALLLLADDTGATNGGGDNTDRVETLITDGTRLVSAISADADSDREAAAARTLQTRWSRHLSVVETVRSLDDGGERQSAIDQFRGEGLATFNGVNTAIESVLVDNRGQFSDGVARAASSVELTPWLSLLLTVAAGLLATVSVQRRLGDYR